MQAAMQKAFVAPISNGSIKQGRSQSVRVSCAHQGGMQERKNIAAESAKLLSAGLLSAAMIMGAPAAEAKVILVQPEVKNFVNNTAPKAKGEKAAKATKAKAPPAAAMTSEGFDFKPLALPLSILVLGGGAAAVTTLDPGFAEMMVEGGAKDSRTFAGYETNLKNTPFFGGSGAIPTSVPGNNTKPGTGKGGKKAGKK